MSDKLYENSGSKYNTCSRRTSLAQMVKRTAMGAMGRSQETEMDAIQEINYGDYQN